MRALCLPCGILLLHLQLLSLLMWRLGQLPGMSGNGSRESSFLFIKLANKIDFKQAPYRGSFSTFQTNTSWKYEPPANFEQ
jgi:hypothetical protein